MFTDKSTSTGETRDSKTLQLHVNSADADSKKLCGLIAVQPLKCPFRDREEDAEFHSRYSCSTERAAMNGSSTVREHKRRSKEQGLSWWHPL